MGYCIKYDDIRALLNTCSTQFNNWQSQLQNILSASNGITGMAAFKGDAAASVKAYMQEVHNVLIYAILQAIAEFRSKLLLYSDGFYRIEADKYAELSEDALQAALTKYDGYCRNFVDDSCRLSSALNNVRDIFNVSPPSSYPVCGDYDTFKKRVSKLKDDVGSYERSKLGSDMLDLAAMIKQLKATIKDFSSKSANSISSYQPGSVAASWSFQDLCRQLNRSVAYCDSHVGAVKAAADHQAVIAEKIAAEERLEQGVLDFLVSAAIIVGGVITIVATAGLATPLVVAGAVGAVGSIAYGASNMAQSVQDIYYGATGDAHTAAFNPLRDTLFCGNQEAYDIFGTVSGLLCAVTAPAAMGIKGVQGIGGVTSYARAIGTQYAKAAISAGAGYLGNEAGEAMGLPKWASFLMGVGVGTAAGIGTEALDRTFNISGYHINSYGELMTPEDAASYNKHWDDLASGKHLPPGMDADDLARYNLGLQKVDENLALSKVDPDALTRLRAEEALRAYRYYKSLVQELDVSTDPDQAVFYSGKGNRELAEEFAKLNGKTTLEDTPGGKYLDSLKLFGKDSPLTREQALEVWGDLSKRYAQGASGNTYGFVNGSRVDSIFNTIEFPELQTNGNVTNVFTELFK